MRGNRLVECRAGRRLLLVICALVAGPTAADAVECGEVLTQDTLLDADLTCPGDGLIVGADGIVIDLGGHVIRSLSFLGAGIRNEGHNDVEIRNGRIEGEFDPGVELVGARGNLLEALVVRDAEVVLIDSHENRIQRNRIGDNHGNGLVLLRSGYNDVIDNVVSDNDNHGILLDFSDHNQLQGNTIQRNDDHIVLWNSNYNNIISNFAQRSGSTGIAILNSHRNLIARNDLSNSETAGVSVHSSHYNRIESNFVSNGFWGVGIIRLILSDHNELAANAVVGTRSSRCNGPSRGVPGIRVSSGTGNRLTGNSVTESCDDGILVESIASQTRLLRNLAADNGDDGLDVEDRKALIVGNTALENGDYGIEAVPGVRGGGNRALGNGNPEQCLGIACH